MFVPLDLRKHRNFAQIPEAGYCGQSHHLWARTPSGLGGIYNFTDAGTGEVQARIRGGSKSELNEFPWMAFLKVKLSKLL